MHFAALLTVVAGLAAAAPVEHSNLGKRGKTPFSVHQTNTGKPANKPVVSVALAKVYAKYGKTGSMPASVRVASENAVASGSVTASPVDGYDSEYLCQISVGTPAQTLTMDFDTGSSDLWMFSSEMSSSETSGHSVYTPSSSSSSSLMSGQSWNITYGDGSGAWGNVYSDTVTIGGSTFASQAVEPATHASDSFVSDTSSDGLVGLAWSAINTVRPTQQKTFFDNIKSTLPSPVFTADLKYHAAGTYNFGYIDSSAYTGSIGYVSCITNNGWWEFATSGYAIGSAAITSSGFNAIADTGTSLLLLSDSIVSAYWSQNGGTYNSDYGAYLFPCSTTLSSLTLQIGSHNAIVPGAYLNYGAVSSSTCYGGLQSDDGIGFSILGDVFLKSQFVVFNGGSTPQVGFASKDLGQYNPTTTSSTTTTTHTTTTTPKPTTTTTTTKVTTTTTTPKPTTTTTTPKPTTTTTTTKPTTTTTKATTTTTTTKPTTTTTKTTTTTPKPTTTTTITHTTTTTPHTTTTTTHTTTTTTHSTTTTSSSSTAIPTCFSDASSIPNRRAFTGPSTMSLAMTNAYCSKFCSNQGYSYSGTEASFSCYCSNSAPTIVSKACTSHCPNMLTNEICGGMNALTVSYKGVLGVPSS